MVSRIKAFPALLGAALFAAVTLWAPGAAAQEPETLAGVGQQMNRLAQQAAEARASAQEIIEEHRQTPAAGKLLELKTLFVQKLLQADMLSAALARLEAQGDLEGILKQRKKLDAAEEELVGLKTEVFEHLKSAETVRRLSRVNAELEEAWDKGVAARKALRRWRELGESLQQLDTALERFSAEVDTAQERLAALERQAGTGEGGPLLREKIEHTRMVLASVRERLEGLEELRARKVAEVVRLTGFAKEARAREKFRQTCGELARLEAQARADRAWVGQSFRALVGMLYQPRLIAMHGRVFLKKSGDVVKMLFEPVELDRGDTLQTGPQAGVEIEFEDGSVLSLGPDSRLELPEDGRVWRSLRAGTTCLHAVAAVATTTPLVQVRHRSGAEFCTTVADALCRVSVERGEVELVNIKSGQRLTLQAGQSATITPDVFPDKPD